MILIFKMKMAKLVVKAKVMFFKIKLLNKLPI